MTFRVAFGGQAGTGKSTLVRSISHYLTWYGHDHTVVEIDPYSDTHAVIEGVKTDDERQRRQFVKWPTLERRIARFAGATSELVIGDLPGKLTNPKMPEMLAAADAIVLVGRERIEKDNEPHRARHYRSLTDWEEYCRQLNIPVLARVQSLLPDQPRWPFFIHAEGLDRRPQPQHPAIVTLADILVDSQSSRSHDLPLLAEHLA